MTLARTTLLLLMVGCAETQPPGGGSARQRSAPGKCSACHPAPREHGLASGRWEEFLKSHRRRIRLSEGEKTALYDFLVGGDQPAARVP